METRERGIIFNSEMVRAILEGSKTQTRRIMKPQPTFDVLGDPGCWYPSYFKKNCMHYGNPKHFQKGVVKDFSPFGQPGDRLWVRETFYCDVPDSDPSRLENLYYRSDGDCCDQIPECSCAEVGKPKWRPSIHMPRWASRINLEITDVRVETLQDGGDQDFWGEVLWKQNPWVWCISFKRVEGDL